MLDSLTDDHQVVVTLEDGILEGGDTVWRMVASYLGNTDLKVQNYGVKKAYPDRYNPQDYLAQNGITVDNIVNQVVQSLK